MSIQTLLNDYAKKGVIPKRLLQIFEDFYHSYENVVIENQGDLAKTQDLFRTFLKLLTEQIQSPYQFEPYHEHITAPFDYYRFGINFLTPLIDLKHSTLIGEANLQKITKQIENKENVIFFANHQIEGDPQAISLLTEDKYPKLAQELIMVAGERVLTDPLAIPFSMGCNLLCIYSKKYIDSPPEDKLKKQLHNKNTMHRMRQLLSEGGHAIYVAPSGGRDRKNKKGEIEIAPFDPRSIEMFYLMTKKASVKTHFYPLTLHTYSILPPPQTVQVELGEKRITKGGPIHICFGPEIDMESFPGSDEKDKHHKRKLRADYIWNQVNDAYAKF